MISMEKAGELVDGKIEQFMEVETKGDMEGAWATPEQSQVMFEGSGIQLEEVLAYVSNAMHTAAAAMESGVEPRKAVEGILLHAIATAFIAVGAENE